MKLVLLYGGVDSEAGVAVFMHLLKMVINI